MKLRIAKKVLRKALETGIQPRGSTLLRAVNAHPCGSRHHPRKYWASGLTAAFIRQGHSIHAIRFGLDSARINKEIAVSNNHQPRRGE